MRAFIAIPLGQAASDALLPLQEGFDQGREVPASDLHVTLAFLGDQNQAALSVLHDALAEIVPADLRLMFKGVEIQGGRRPALAWAKVDSDPGLSGLHKAVRGAVHSADIVLPRARFRPHVTLIRFGRNACVPQSSTAAWLAQNGDFRAGPFPVDEFCMYHSRLTPDGPIYDILAQYRTHSAIR